MIDKIPAAIIIQSVRPRPDAETSLEHTRSMSKALADLAEAIETMSPPTAQELRTSAAEGPLRGRSFGERIMTSAPETGALACHRVLIAEDEYFLANDIAQALQKLGAQVVGPVPTVERALALLAEAPVDLAVLDINLRGNAVFPVADVLRTKGVPFVFATGYDEAAVPPSFRDIPRWQKPYKIEDLANALPAIVQRS